MREVLDYNVLPKHYELKITVKEKSFEGEEVVHLDVQKDTKQFNLNIWRMKLSDVKLKVEKTVLEPRIEINEEVVTLHCEELLKAGSKCLLSLKYTGEYSENMWGFCKSFYNGEMLFSTDFEPTCARRAFPCWDQPDMKATFDIALKPLEGFVALSNSSLKEIKDGFYCFNTTPKMSTYIVAFISGKLESIETKTKRNIPIAVYAHKDEKEWGRYALNVAVECLDFFEEYFGIEYPLPKLDLVSIPAFVSGAMENWGLVTFRKTSLLFKEGSSSLRSKKLISETVCHELAHMWFGNLVTMSWWNDLWLNEGFATWAASLAMSHLSKSLVDWEVWTEFINSDMESGMFYDCLDTSHPIAVEVNKPSEISQIFDSISYSKGASMIRMLEGFIGREEFREGIKSYLEKYKYGNATTQDLWNSFNCKVDVRDLMNDWINKKGFPLVSVKEDGDKLILSQQQFLISGNKTNEIWQIPIAISWLNKNKETFLMKEKTMEIKKESSIYKINAGAFGFYRTTYETQNLAHLLEIKNSVDDRLNLINDISALCSAKTMKAIDFIVLSELFREENNTEVLASLFASLNKFRSMWYENKDVTSHINEVVMDVVGKRVYDIDLFATQVGVEEISTNALLVGNALKCKDEKITQRLAEAFERRQEVNPEFMRSVFTSVIDEKYEEIFEISKNSTIPEEKTVALTSLAMVSDPTNLRIVMDKYQEIEPHDSIYFFNWLANNESNRDLILSYICDNFDAIRSYMKNDRLFAYVVERVLATASTEQLATKIIELINTKKNGEIVSAINKAIEKIENNLSFKEYNFEIVKN
ncbi:putative M1 family aminopeptidase 1 [Nosema granulosis]|uniref:Aminopeptidase n=1 Tax=Nosema granulosis TaxID=83296 RepID=A0A9P6GYD2_9MICR|nr:putative M1 family aminopeptidase 1 [Nosema granulosis]